MLKIAAFCDTHFVGIVPHFTGPIATAALVNTLGTFSGPVLMEYNYQGRTMPHLPQCLDFKDGKLYPNDRPGLGVEVDLKQLTQIAEFTEPDHPESTTLLPPRRLHHQLVVTQTHGCTLEVFRRRRIRGRNDQGNAIFEETDQNWRRRLFYPKNAIAM